MGYELRYWMNLDYVELLGKQINYNLARRFQRGYPLFIDSSKEGEKPNFKAKVITLFPRYGTFFSGGSGDSTINEGAKIRILIDGEVVHGE